LYFFLVGMKLLNVHIYFVKEHYYLLIFIYYHYIVYYHYIINKKYLIHHLIRLYVNLFYQLQLLKHRLRLMMLFTLLIRVEQKQVIMILKHKENVFYQYMFLELIYFKEKVFISNKNFFFLNIN
jgi:hypothetical protein